MLRKGVADGKEASGLKFMRLVRVGDRKETNGQSLSSDHRVAVRVLADRKPGDRGGSVMVCVVVAP